MKFQGTVALALPILSAAYPWMNKENGNGKEDLLRAALKARDEEVAASAQLEERQSTDLSCYASNGALYTAASGKTYMVECYNDHFAGDLSMVYVQTLKQCIDACDSTATCKAFSWVSSANGYNNPCYLKSSIGKSQQNSGVWGGKVIEIASTPSLCGSTSNSGSSSGSSVSSPVSSSTSSTKTGSSTSSTGISSTGTSSTGTSSTGTSSTGTSSTSTSSIGTSSIGTSSITGTTSATSATSQSSQSGTSTQSAASSTNSVVSLAGTIGGVLDSTLLTSTLGTLSGLLGSVAENIDPAGKRPEEGYYFQAPGPNDSRGPCPGLNLLANYGYLPRNGYVSFGQVLEATARGFNMGTDLATVLSVFSVLADGNIAEESWWLGTDPTHVGGLNRHSTVEADASPNREDYYNGCGDNHHLSSRMFKNNVAIVNSSASKQFDIAAMSAQWALNSKFSQANNPYFYYFPFPAIVSTAAYNFYPNFFSNGTYGLGGVANYESISAIVGAQYNKDTDTFEYVPERWPENWYRRSYPYGAVQALGDAFTQIYPSNPVPLGPLTTLAQNGLNLTTLLCFFQQGFNSITPLALAGTVAEGEAAISWATSKLTGLLPAGTVLGCPTNAISNNFYPNATGGPLSPRTVGTPADVFRNSGNNVYNTTYFRTAPVQPQCNPQSN